MSFEASHCEQMLLLCLMRPDDSSTASDRTFRLPNGECVHLAGMGIRFRAGLSDWGGVFVVLFFWMFIVFGLTLAGGALPGWTWFTVFAGYLLVLVYEPSVLAFWGRTHSKSAKHLRVIRVDSGGVPGLKAWVRWGVIHTPFLAVWLILWLGDPEDFFFFIYVLFLPMLAIVRLIVFASVFLDSDRRGWYDKIAGTAVVENKAEREAHRRQQQANRESWEARVAARKATRDAARQASGPGTTPTK